MQKYWRFKVDANSSGSPSGIDGDEPIEIVDGDDENAQDDLSNVLEVIKDEDDEAEFVSHPGLQQCVAESAADDPYQGSGELSAADDPYQGSEEFFDAADPCQGDDTPSDCIGAIDDPYQEVGHGTNEQPAADPYQDMSNDAIDLEAPDEPPAPIASAKVKWANLSDSEIDERINLLKLLSLLFIPIICFSSLPSI